MSERPPDQARSLGGKTPPLGLSARVRRSTQPVELVDKAGDFGLGYVAVESDSPAVRTCLKWTLLKGPFQRPTGISGIPHKTDEDRPGPRRAVTKKRPPRGGR